MKRLLLNGIAILTLLFTGIKSYSADLIVEEFGLAPTYSSIQAAVNAASDGDRILIMNRAGGIPWIENISINKAIELHSYQNDTFFVVQGNYYIYAANGRTVTINGMSNTSGFIAASTGTGPCEVNIFDCKLTSGYLNFDDVDFHLNVVGTELVDGYVDLYRGNVIGCDITYSGTHDAISCYQTTGAYTGDTVMIIGNKIYLNYSSTSYSAISAYNSQVVFHIKNNLILHRYYGIRMQYSTSSSYPNLIYNNAVRGMNTTGTCFGIYVNNQPAGGVIEIMNNVVDEVSSGTTYGIYSTSNSGQVNAYYNHVDMSHSATVSGSYTFQSNNTTTLSQTINTATGAVSGSPIDGGNPAQSMYDLDLTRGDAGCYGGSYTLNNFFPLFTGSARVFYVDFPFNIRQGSTLKVEGYSYDR